MKKMKDWLTEEELDRKIEHRCGTSGREADSRFLAAFGVKLFRRLLRLNGPVIRLEEAIERICDISSDYYGRFNFSKPDLTSKEALKELKKTVSSQRLFLGKEGYYSAPNMDWMTVRHPTTGYILKEVVNVTTKEKGYRFLFYRD